MTSAKATPLFLHEATLSRKKCRRCRRAPNCQFFLEKIKGDGSGGFRRLSDRFGPGREEDRKSAYRLIGFGGGRHRCIGLTFAYLQVKAIWSVLLRRYELSLVDPWVGSTRRLQEVRLDVPVDEAVFRR